MDALLELLDLEKSLMEITVDGKTYDGNLKEMVVINVDFCQTLTDGSCLHFSPFMFALRGRVDVKVL